MSDLKDLVPTLELCKKIPAGEFTDSAFVWVVNGDYQPRFQIVDKRKYPFIPEDGATLYPAPTLAELLSELPLDVCCGMEHHGDFWISYKHEVCIQEKSAATAALKLWLKLKGIEDGK